MRRILAAALILLATTVVVVAGAFQSPTVQLTPCEVRGVEGKALCGTHEVFENRATKRGRKIGLKIIVLPATGQRVASDAWTYIAGGPGSSATEEAAPWSRAFAKVREQRDLVFVDQRGTGGSNPLTCTLYNPADPQSYLGYFLPLDDVRKCRTELERKADLTLYTTAIAMDDLDEVRAALGYKQLNIFGASYGTRAALVYLKRHPQSVRTVLLFGVAPTDQFMPLAFAQNNERALQGVLAECAADETCNKAFPEIRAEAKTVLERLLREPVETEVRVRGNPAKVKLSRNLAAEAIRYMLYSPTSASRVPFVLHRAAAGDFAPLAEAALLYRTNIVAGGSNGLYLSITCAEDLPWIKAGEGERLAANTFLGDYRLVQQREACALWPRGTIPKEHSEPTRSSAPVLIITGEWDPVTPPSNGDAVARHLSNSLHVVVPHAAHGIGGLEGTDCIDNLTTDFFDRATVKGLDTSCVKAIKRRGWAMR